MKNRLRQERLRAKLTQVQLAELVGTNRQTIHDLEYGKREARGGLMLKIAHCLGKPVEEIFLASEGTTVSVGIARCLQVPVAGSARFRQEQ